MSISLIFPTINQFQQLERNLDTWYKDEGDGKRLKSHAGEHQGAEEKEGKEGAQKEIGIETDRHITHRGHVKLKKNHTTYNKFYSILH